MSGQDAPGGYYRASVARSLPAFIARYPGVSVERLLAEAGIDPARADVPDAVQSLSHAIDLLERAAALTKNAFFGADFAAQIPWVDLGVLGYVMMNSPTLGAGIENMIRFALAQREGGIGLEIDGADARVSYQLSYPGVGVYQQQAELILTLIARFAREATGDASWAPAEVRLARAAPADREHHRRFFGARCRFDQDRNELILPAVDLDRPLRSSDPGLLPILVRHAEDCLARMPPADDELGAVRRAVIELLSAGDCSIERTADRLHVSTRSLQRRLAARGLSFTALIEETRFALSERYLRDPSLSLTETAYLLAYSDLSAFSRAFRRWTGESALEYRKRLTVEPA